MLYGVVAEMQIRSLRRVCMRPFLCRAFYGNARHDIATIRSMTALSFAPETIRIQFGSREVEMRGYD